MIIWAGYGFIVFIIVFVNSLLIEIISELFMHDDNFYQSNLLPLGCSFFLSALVIRLLDNYFNEKRNESKGTYIFDAVTIAKSNHHLFFIPFKYWTYIMIVLGLGVIVYQTLRNS